MTAAEFHAIHGDPTNWTTADHESYANLAAIDALPQPATLHLLSGGATRSSKSTPTAQPATAA